MTGSTGFFRLPLGRTWSVARLGGANLSCSVRDLVCRFCRDAERRLPSSAGAPLKLLRDRQPLVLVESEHISP